MPSPVVWFGRSISTPGFVKYDILTDPVLLFWPFLWTYPPCPERDPRGTLCTYLITGILLLLIEFYPPLFLLGFSFAAIQQPIFILFIYIYIYYFKFY